MGEPIYSVTERLTIKAALANCQPMQQKSFSETKYTSSIIECHNAAIIRKRQKQLQLTICSNVQKTCDINWYACYAIQNQEDQDICTKAVGNLPVLSPMRPDIHSADTLWMSTMVSPTVNTRSPSDVSPSKSKRAMA